MSGLQKPNIGGPGGTAAGTTFSDPAPPHLGANVQAALAQLKKSGQGAKLYVDVSGNDATAVRGSIVNKFLTIGAALAAASPGDTIAVSSGTFVENVTALSGITIIGADRRSTIIDGTVTWTPTDSVDEIASLRSLTVTGAVSMDATGKTGGLGYFYILDASAPTGTSIGRPGLNSDGFWLEQISLPENDGTRWTMDVTSGVFIADFSDVADVDAHGDCLISMRRGIVYGHLNHDGLGTTALIQMQVVGNVLLTSPVGSGPFQEARDTIFYGDVSLGPGGWVWSAYHCSFLSTIGAHGDPSSFVNTTPDTDFQGASSGSAGASGFVPKPNAGQETFLLRGDGGWADAGTPININQTTTDNTPTATWTRTLDDNTTYAVEASIVTVDETNARRAIYKRRAMVSRSGGGAAVLNPASQVVGTDIETDGGLDAAFDVSGNDVQLVLTGLAAITFQWNARITIHGREGFGGPS